MHLVYHSLTMLSNIVEVTTDFNQTLIGHNLAIFIVVSINQTILYDHLAFGIKLIPCLRHSSTIRESQPIGIADIVGFTLGCISNTVKTRSRSEVVEVSVHILQTELRNTILAVVQVSCIPVKAISRM